MLTKQGCHTRRARLLERLKPTEPLLLGDPLHLRYFAGCYVDPFSLGADYGGLLQITPDGETTLFLDARLPKSVDESKVDHVQKIVWYDGKSAGHGNRRESLRAVVEQHGGRVHDHVCDPRSKQLWAHTTEMRRVKDTDEIDTLKTCMRVTEQGHDWARKHIQAGMTELDVYLGIFSACSSFAHHAVIVYGDFAVSSGSAKRGGGPTEYVLKNGDTMILDFSLVISGYRSDFTNTHVVGGQPSTAQQDTFELCLAAMKAGEAKLTAGAACVDVYQAVNNVLVANGHDLKHHAGHGIGVSHPEAPFFVEKATETLQVGDVVTLEPGLYLDGIGGMRIEHNYLITEQSFEQLSQHKLSLN